MAITISGQNNNDKIVASDGVLDMLSGFNVVGVMTANSFDVGSNIKLGNAGIITATTVVGNVTGNLTGNINHTSNILLQISGSEKFRVGTSGQFGIAGANYGTSGQVLTSGGSGSAPTWTTITQGVTSDGSQNTVGGTNAGDSIVSGGTENTVFGYNAGTAISTGDNNTFFGSRAGRSISTGLQNTGVGYNVMGNTSGTGNAALGQNAGNGIGAGSYNVALGWSALSDVSTNGANNIVIGKQANVSAANMSNEVTIGNSDINHFRIPGIGVSFSEGGAVFSGIVTASSYRGDGSQLTGIGDSDKIEEGNSSVEVIDTGTGKIDLKVDGSYTARFKKVSGNRTYMLVGNPQAVSNDYGINSGHLIVLANSGSEPATLRLFGWGAGSSDGTINNRIDFASHQSGSGGQTFAKIETVIRGSNDNSSDMTFHTAASATVSERLRITSAGKVGVGTDGPSQQFTSYADSGYPILANSSSNGIGLGGNGVIVFGNKDLGSYAAGAIDATDFAIKISGTEKFKITSGGDLEMTGGTVSLKEHMVRVGNRTTAQINAGVSTATGSVTLNTSTNNLLYYANAQWNTIKKVGNDGSTQTLAARSAKELLDNGFTTNGVYWLDMHGGYSAGNAKLHYCLMDSSYDGGGWTMLYSMIHGNNFASGSNYSFSLNVGSPTTVNDFTAGNWGYDRRNTFTPAANDQFLIRRSDNNDWKRFVVSTWSPTANSVSNGWETLNRTDGNNTGHPYWALGQMYDSSGNSVSGHTHFNGCAKGGNCNSGGGDGSGFGNYSQWLDAVGNSAYGGGYNSQSAGGSPLYWGQGLSLIHI